MKKNDAILRWFVAAILLFAVSVQSIVGQQVKVSAKLDSVKILIGDQIKLRLEMERPSSLNVDFPIVPDTLAGKIEVLQKSPVDTISTKGDKLLKLVQTYLVTSFDSGEYRLSPFWFRINNNGTIDSIATNELVLSVATLEIDTTKGPTDIKMPYDAPLTLKEVMPWILGIILVGAVLFLLLYSIKRRKKNLPVFTKPAKPKEPAHIIALRELDRIKDEKLWQKDKIKEFYSQVTDALRVYIEDRFGIQAMEQTSYETIVSFHSRKGIVSEKSLNTMSHILTLADLVKFAKYQPLPDDHNITLVNAYFFVNDTKIEEIKKPEKPDSEANSEAVTLK